MSRTRKRRKQNNKLKIILWTVSILLVIGVAGFFAANYAIDKVLGSLSVGTSSPQNVADSTQVEEANTSLAPQSSPTGAIDTDSTKTAIELDGTTLQEAQPHPSSAPNQAEGTKDGTVQSEAKSEVDLNNYTASVSADKAQAIEEEVSLKEKAKVASVLLGSLSASDISTLQSLASGGLTVEEKKKARAIMLEKLTPDQYNELIAIAAKYGVSQGKKYEEVKKTDTE